MNVDEKMDPFDIMKEVRKIYDDMKETVDRLQYLKSQAGQSDRGRALAVAVTETEKVRAWLGHVQATCYVPVEVNK